MSDLSPEKHYEWQQYRFREGAPELVFLKMEIARVRKIVRPRPVVLDPMSYRKEVNYLSFLLERYELVDTQVKTQKLWKSLTDEDGNLLSNSSEEKLNAVQKVIILNEIGIIDFLRSKQPFSTSVSSLADVLSLLVGEKKTTLQPYLNALLNNTQAENKHPYYSKSTVEKIKNLLINKGIQPK